MARKKVWLTWLSGAESSSLPDECIDLLNQYGFDVSGDYWIDDLTKMAWTELADKLTDPPLSDVWIIAGEQNDYQADNNRYGLSMVAAMVSQKRKSPLQGICLGRDYLPEREALPSLLQSFQCLNLTDTSWVPKVVTTAHTKPMAEYKQEYRFTVIAHPLLGQWFEVGPREHAWSSVMLGVSADTKITQHAVGVCGSLPETSILEYPTEGIQAKLGDVEYTAWSVQNSIDPGLSYFVKVDGYPRSIIIGGHPDDDTVEVSRIDLI